LNFLKKKKKLKGKRKGKNHLDFNHHLFNDLLEND